MVSFVDSVSTICIFSLLMSCPFCKEAVPPATLMPATRGFHIGSALVYPPMASFSGNAVYTLTVSDSFNVDKEGSFGLLARFVDNDNFISLELLRKEKLAYTGKRILLSVLN